MLGKIVDYGGMLLALAIITRNGAEVSRLISAFSMGARAITSALLVGSSSGGNPDVGVGYA